MDSILNELLKPKSFSIFIENGMRNSTYTPWWRNEMDVEYEPTKQYKAALAEYTAAVAGSIVDKNAEKPRHGMPSPGEMVGSISRMADEWQMDNEVLDRYIYLENRYRATYGGLSVISGNARSEADFRNLVTFLMNPYEKAAIAPHKRIDLMYYQGLYNGAITVTNANNPSSQATFQFDLGITKHKAKGAAWGTANSKPLDDINNAVNAAEAMGKQILRIRMNRYTFLSMMQCNQMAGIFRLNIANGKVTNAPAVGVETVNQYLETIGLPTIVIETPKPIMLSDGSTVNAIPNNRVVFMMADRVAVLKVADSIERVDPLPNKVYATYEDNLIGQFRNEKGRFVDYEMWAFPVFTGRKNYFILNTDEVQA